MLPGPPYPHYDLEGLWEFILDALATLHADHGVDAISVTTHGASAVLLDADGGLAAPMLDYEHPRPRGRLPPTTTRCAPTSPTPARPACRWG